MSFPIITEQRFFKTRLNQLFDLESPVIEGYVRGFVTIREIADAIITDIQYPFYLGQPDDTHVWNAFHLGQKWCKRIDADFWQKGSETIAVGVGDCEDSSIAFVTCAGRFGLSEKDVYEVFGVVRDASTGEILGGHGWSVFKFPGELNYRLYESTLDTPPLEYPEMGDFDVVCKPYRLATIIYDPTDWVYNWKEFHQLGGSMSYDKRKKREKETREKYEKIGEAWKLKTKFQVLWHKRFAGTKRIIRRLIKKG